MSKLEQKALCVVKSFVRLLMDNGYHLEMIYDPQKGTKINCMKYTDDMKESSTCEGVITLYLGGEVKKIKGPNQDFVEYVKERLK